MSRQDWYRKQCALFSVRLGEWLEANPGRMTKARRIIVDAERELSRNFKNDEQAFQALLAIDELIFCSPTAAAKVLFKATRPSESYNKWLRETAPISN